MSDVAYLASYLSRAKFLSSELVASIIQRFGNIVSCSIVKMISMLVMKLIQINMTVFC